MNLSPEEIKTGRDNFENVIGFTRREFLAGAAAAAAVPGAGLGAFYFGYNKVKDPVRIGVIGTGDEGSVLIGAHNPEYARVVAIAEIRPYNVYRAFHGDESSDNALKVRPGLMSIYGYQTEAEARKNIKVYSESYEALLDDPDVEAVVIALPLHLHHACALSAMRKGKHVLCEKLMAHNVGQCKDMARVAKQTNQLLAIGHQRHYSILYDNAVDTIRRGLLGDIHYIDCLWHRGNLPGKDSWQPPLPDSEMEKRIADWQQKIDGGASGKELQDLRKNVRIEMARYADREVEANKYGYEDRKLDNGYDRSALEELIRWRLWARTGGGLMAELGGHQLDASSIFLSALRVEAAESTGAKRSQVLPLSVSAIGGRHIFPLDRDTDDHVYCTFEFPAKDYDKDPNKRVVMTYSSINGNGFGGYGETVYGTAGTLVLAREENAMLYKGSNTATNVKVSAAKGSGGPTLDTTDSGPGGAKGGGGAGALSGPVSRGYREEIEHLAYCIRNPDPENQPRCSAQVGMTDAIMALTANLAMKQRKNIEFKPEWFNVDSDETPEGIAPTIAAPGKTSVAS